MVEYNFKSQRATTIEQSQRLIALGLRKETADMTRHLRHLERRQNLEAEVETWIQENYPHLMEG